MPSHDDGLDFHRQLERGHGGDVKIDIRFCGT
jgi:hypothetical protein